MSREALGECMRSGKVVPLSQLVRDGLNPSLWVARDWYEPPLPKITEAKPEQHKIVSPEFSIPPGEGEAAPALVFDAQGRLV